jgi:tricorn protease
MTIQSGRRTVRKISYTDNSWSVYWLDVKSGVAKKVAGTMYGPSRARTIYHSWSPDSKWLAYTLHESKYSNGLCLFARFDKSFAITDGLSEVTEPISMTAGNISTSSDRRMPVR